MPSFALVCEGITDQIAIDTILCGFYDDDIDVTRLQPIRDATDEYRQGNFAGWELVLEYCTKSDRLTEALSLNDYLIIQIDTDCAEHVNFGVALTLHGKDKPVQDLINEVKEVIASKIGQELFQHFSERIFFAISVHSLECWLLPLHVNSNTNPNQTKDCTNRLEHTLNKAGILFLKTARCYEVLAKKYAKRKYLDEHKSKNQSFFIFLESLPKNT